MSEYTEARPERICYDMILPRDLRQFAQPESALTARAAILRAKRWPVGATLSIRFIGGTTAQHDVVKQFAPEWTRHANLKFAFDNAPDAEIRIAFANDGAWSYIGTDCLEIPRNQPTMNYGWLDEAVVLHEFGHAIGMIHEHQNPRGGIRWNRPQVYRDLGGPPNFWDRATVDNNMFRTYDVNQLNATQLDRLSIMLYRIPATWTTDGWSSDFNAVLSETDKTFIGDESNYPGLDTEEDAAVALEVTEVKVHRSEIGQPGEQDLYQFLAARPGRYTVETDGMADLMLSLYGPDSRTTLVAQDDDSGPGANPRISMDLAAGTYYAQVRHYNATSGTGAYGIRVSREDSAPSGDVQGNGQAAAADLVAAEGGGAPA